MLWNRFIWLLLMFPRITDSKVTVKQTPAWINVAIGDTLNLHCKFSVDATHSENTLVGAYTWYKDRKMCNVCNNCTGYIGRVQEAGKSAFLNLKLASISITRMKLNDTGTYYCQVKVLNCGLGTGEGTRVTVNAHIDSEETPSPYQWNTNLLIFSVVVLVPVALIIIKMFSTRHSSRPPYNGTREQVANELCITEASRLKNLDQDLSDSTIYAKLNISRSDTHHRPPDQAACTKLHVLSENPAVSESAPFPKRNEESVVYSAPSQPAQSLAGVRFDPLPTATRKDEQIVYATVRL
ncbi:uncharacterized protein LOC122541177 [Chiloscyllium plagiosum]|uniref:uncharacterized protein LOC122541177 n=1 Tax=Chiloscyllium plagiosum TaxID=36176 RepID=UPI001CB88864|nr:uncharacterized protein LOC122541177 [Chiloscyllium plagiosum]